MNRLMTRSLAPVRPISIELDAVPARGEAPPLAIEFLKRQAKIEKQLDQLTQIVVAQQNHAIQPAQVQPPTPAPAPKSTRRPRIDRARLAVFGD